jgi:hypothetical protein
MVIKETLIVLFVITTFCRTIVNPNENSNLSILAFSDTFYILNHVHLSVKFNLTLFYLMVRFLSDPCCLTRLTVCWKLWRPDRVIWWSIGLIHGARLCKLKSVDVKIIDWSEKVRVFKFLEFIFVQSFIISYVCWKRVIRYPNVRWSLIFCRITCRGWDRWLRWTRPWSVRDTFCGSLFKEKQKY